MWVDLKDLTICMDYSPRWMLHSKRNGFPCFPTWDLYSVTLSVVYGIRRYVCYSIISRVSLIHYYLQEYVRSKAFSLIRTFGTLHLRSAFRCWEAYFLTANDRQKTSVIKLMVQLSALFPDWQVIQWESLLEALEAKQEHAGEEEENADRRSFAESVDILERYTRYPPTQHMKPKEQEEDIMQQEQSKGENQEPVQEQEGETNALVDSENCKILMVTLALQLLSCHLPVDTIQVSRLKYILVQFMGFQECHRYATPAPATNGNAGEWVVSFGNLVYNYSDPLHHSAMVAASRGLKKVVDSFAPLPAETVASMAPDVLERNRVELAENSSPGVHFIDVVLKMFNSGINLTKLSHMMLKTWLETVLIVLYKVNDHILSSSDLKLTCCV